MPTLNWSPTFRPSAAAASACTATGAAPEVSAGQEPAVTCTRVARSGTRANTAVAPDGSPRTGTGRLRVELVTVTVPGGSWLSNRAVAAAA